MHSDADVILNCLAILFLFHFSLEVNLSFGLEQKVAQILV